MSTNDVYHSITKIPTFITKSGFNIVNNYYPDRFSSDQQSFSSGSVESYYLDGYYGWDGRYDLDLDHIEDPEDNLKFHQNLERFEEEEEEEEGEEVDVGDHGIEKLDPTFHSPKSTNTNDFHCPCSCLNSTSTTSISSNGSNSSEEHSSDSDTQKTRYIIGKIKKLILRAKSRSNSTIGHPPHSHSHSHINDPTTTTTTKAINSKILLSPSQSQEFFKTKSSIPYDKNEEKLFNSNYAKKKDNIYDTKNISSEKYSFLFQKDQFLKTYICSPPINPENHSSTVKSFNLMDPGASLYIKRKDKDKAKEDEDEDENEEEDSVEDEENTTSEEDEELMVTSKEIDFLKDHISCCRSHHCISCHLQNHKRKNHYFYRRHHYHNHHHHHHYHYPMHHPHYHPVFMHRTHESQHPSPTAINFNGNSKDNDATLDHIPLIKNNSSDSSLNPTDYKKIYNLPTSSTATATEAAVASTSTSTAAALDPTFTSNAFIPYSILTTTVDSNVNNTNSNDSHDLITDKENDDNNTQQQQQQQPQHSEKNNLSYCKSIINSQLEHHSHSMFNSPKFSKHTHRHHQHHHSVSATASETHSSSFSSEPIKHIENCSCDQCLHTSLIKQMEKLNPENKKIPSLAKPIYNKNHQTAKSKYNIFDTLYYETQLKSQSNSSDNQTHANDVDYPNDNKNNPLLINNTHVSHGIVTVILNNSDKDDYSFFFPRTST